jgi:hypothetical protein
MDHEQASPPWAASRPPEKVARATLSPLAPITKREIRRWSPITEPERRRVESVLGRLDPDRMSPERWQRVADALRGPLERVDRVATAGYIEIGRWLLRLREKARHGSWTCLFRGAPNAIETPLPLDVKKAQALMRISEHPVLSNPKNWNRLPMTSVRTLDEITRLAATYDVQAMVNRREITPHTTYRQIMALVRGGGPFAPTRPAAPSLTPRTDAPESDPLDDVRRAIHLCAAPRSALIACLHAELATLAAQDPETGDPEGDPRIAAETDDEEEEEATR